MFSPFYSTIFYLRSVSFDSRIKYEKWDGAEVLIEGFLHCSVFFTLLTSVSPTICHKIIVQKLRSAFL